MTASHGTSSSQNKRKTQRPTQTDNKLPPPPGSQSSRRLEVLAASSPGNDQKLQSYRLRSTKMETGKESLDVSLRPSYLSDPSSHHSTLDSSMNTSQGPTVADDFRGSNRGNEHSFSASTPLSKSDTDSSHASSSVGSPLPPPPPPPSPKDPPNQEVIKLSDVMARLDALSGLNGKMDAMAEDLKQLRSIQETTTQLGVEVTQVKESIGDLQTAVSTLEGKEEEVELNQQAIAKELLDLKQIVSSLQTQQKQQPMCQQQSVSQSDMDFFKLKTEAALRWNNLIFEGIKEPQSDREGSTRRQIQSFCRNMLGISHADIDRAYRLGKPRAASAPPRPILVRFIRPGDREDIWRAKSRLADVDDNQFSIKEDLPTQLRPIMAALTRVFQSAKRYPHKYNAFIRDFKIYINGEPFGADNLEALPKDLRPSHASTPGNSKVVVFFGKESRFSNHYPSPFSVDDCDFGNMEQFLAHSRARFANDQHLMDRAMASPDPAEAKRILNLLRDAPGQADWEDERHDILRSGLLAKFKQNKDLGDYLLTSEERQLGEASRNKVWGIGLTLTDRDRFNTNLWKGGNLLGKTLMEVRQILSSEKAGVQQGADTVTDTHQEPEVEDAASLLSPTPDHHHSTD